MKKVIGLVAIVAMLLASFASLTVVLAHDDDDLIGEDAKLLLWEKDPSDWSIVAGGASGELEFDLAGPTFVFDFEAEGLLPDTDYSLIYYGDPWPGDNPGALIASGTTDDEGELELEGSVDLGMDLPHSADANYPGGAKIWLVLSSDYNASTNSMVGWNPTEYLFENNLITYDDTDV